MNLNKVSLQARHISLSYGATEVLKGVNIRIEPGEFCALLRLIAGFNQHQRGELLIDGKDITGTPPHLRNVGMVFQNYALWPHMTVWDNVAFGLVERKESRDVIRRKVGAALELVGLQQYGSRRPGQLSGGQQQRVAGQGQQELKKSTRRCFFPGPGAVIGVLRARPRKSRHGDSCRDRIACCCWRSVRANRGRQSRCAGLPRHGRPGNHAPNWHGLPTAGC